MLSKKVKWPGKHLPSLNLCISKGNPTKNAQTKNPNQSETEKYIPQEGH